MSTMAEFTQSLGKNVSNEHVSVKDNETIVSCLDDKCVELNIHPIETSVDGFIVEKAIDAPTNTKQLVAVHDTLFNLLHFEEHVDAFNFDVDTHAVDYINRFLDNARFTNKQVKQIWNFVKKLDPYCAVRSIESFCTNPEILAIFDVAEEQKWSVWFDHLAIRCGTRQGKNSKDVSEFLKKHHRYVAAPVAKEQHYQFVDGWSAYPLYKVLANGQTMRVFVDQSDQEFPKQIIQHWNVVYGFTSHHIALRCTRVVDGRVEAVSLAELTEKLNEKGVDTLPPTGEITNGLLEQLFTKPQLNENIPDHLIHHFASIDMKLVQQIRNGKLIELVSRAEMSLDDAKWLMSIYKIPYDLQSCPIYPYFLPDQAMHVIRTSVQTDDA